MLNLDDRLIKETLPAIKPNGLAVLLVISIHLNKESGTCFPSHERLMKMTGLGSESVYNALRALKKEGLLISTQSVDSKSKTFSRRTFKLNTDYIGIWVAAKNANPLQEEPLTDLPHTAEPHAVEPDAANHETYLLNELERLNELEQLNKVGESTPAPAEISNTLEEEKNERGKVPPPPAEAAAPDLLVKLYRPENPGMVEAEGIALPEPEKEIQPWEHPNATSPKELKAVILRYAAQKPDNWRDNVLESGRATDWAKERIEDCLTDFCAWQFQQDSVKGKLSQYTAGFSLWLKRQPRFEQRPQPGQSAQKPGFNQPATTIDPPSQYRKLSQI